MENILQVGSLYKSYKNFNAVDGISFGINAGEIVGFIGKNGAGKSTTIKLITSLISATSGEILLCGKNIKNNPQVLENIGAMVETPSFYGYLTARGNLEYFAGFYKDVNKQRIEEVISLLGLSERIDDKVKTYSLGMKQRLGIAVSLLNRPKLLILDEPTNGLDAEGIHDILKFLKEIRAKENVAIFISSHILSQLEVLCDRFIIIEKGKIIDEFLKNKIKETTVENNFYIKTDKLHFTGKLLISQFNIKPKIKNDMLVFHSNESQLPKLLEFLIKNKIAIFGAGKIESALEDKFLSKIKGEK